jgi:hypothetical protein
MSILQESLCAERNPDYSQTSKVPTGIVVSVQWVAVEVVADSATDEGGVFWDFNGGNLA